MARKIYRSSVFGTRTIGVTLAMETGIRGRAFLNPSVYSHSVLRKWMENPCSGRNVYVKYLRMPYPLVLEKHANGAFLSQ